MTLKTIDRVGQRPGIAFLAINDRPDIKMYMAQNIKTWRNMGFNFFEYRFNSDVTNERPLIKKIQELNQRQDIHGIMIYVSLIKDTSLFIFLVAVVTAFDMPYSKNRQ